VGRGVDVGAQRPPYQGGGPTCPGSEYAYFITLLWLWMSLTACLMPLQVIG
jgi:hypothetical protein